jgi:hypothetical protein
MTADAITLRPLPTSPWIRNCWALDYSVLDLRGLIPEGSTIAAITFNGTALKLARHDDHEHIVSACPPVRLEGGYVVVTTKAPASPVEPRSLRRKATAPPVPVYGFTPRSSNP